MGSYEKDAYCGRTQLLCESVINVKPPMYKIVGERFKVKVTECSTYSGNVLVKGIVEKITMYLHEHDHKKNNKKDDGGKKEGNDCKDNKDNKDSKDGKKKDGCGCDEIEDMSYFKKSYCKQVDSTEGIVHYMENTLKFRAVVEMPGIKHGHECKVEAKVKDIGDFVALECNEKGHVTLGKETYVLDIQVYPK